MTERANLPNIQHTINACLEIRNAIHDPPARTPDQVTVKAHDDPGGSRAAPGQLAWHLQRCDTNERIEILELESLAPTLGQAFRDWQILTAGTHGFKDLYHAKSDPAKDYTMTREQWQHSIEVLEKELGLEGQPRAVVMHEKYVPRAYPHRLGAYGYRPHGLALGQLELPRRGSRRNRGHRLRLRFVAGAATPVPPPVIPSRFLTIPPPSGWLRPHWPRKPDGPKR